jgi:hypothetical protein
MSRKRTSPMVQPCIHLLFAAKFAWSRRSPTTKGTETITTGRSDDHASGDAT